MLFATFVVCSFLAWWSLGPGDVPPAPVVENRVGASVVTISENVEVKFANDKGERVLDGSLGVSLGDARKNVSCASKIISYDVTCKWKFQGSKVKLIQLPMIPRIKCTNFVWVAATYWDVLKDCFRIRNAHWYGGAEHFHQTWPIEKGSRIETAYVTGNILQDPDKFYGGVSERFWLSSKGAAIVVNPYIPLYVSLNQTGDGRLCLIGKNGPPYKNAVHSPPALEYTICIGDNVLSVYQDVTKMFFRYPNDIPEERLFVFPTWSTWALYHENVTENAVRELATSIVEHGFPRGVIAVDDRWEKCYGDLEFDRDKFPDPKGMVSALRSQRLHTALWVHPFSNDNCESHKTGMREGYWVRSDNDRFSRVTWWNGRGTILDVTNIQALMWWADKLAKLQTEFGIYAFKFDAGEATWLPRTAHLMTADNLHPNVYTTKYAESAVTRFGRNSEVRVGFRTQHLPAFVRMFDKRSIWNALKMLIPTVLHLGIIGYPFVLPDMVGGHADGEFPSPELYVRWFQASAFFPAIHLSIPPWKFDEKVVDICKKTISLRMRYAQLIIGLAHQSTRDGSPIVRPLWWIAPTDETAHQIDSQFLVGDVLLVAPILHEAQTKRNIYLPSGSWQDELRGTTYRGPLWLHHYTIELHEVGLFTRFSKPS